ncbi:hypothetical protein VTO73DRAFT_15314 [Trametes versicolor]
MTSRSDEENQSTPVSHSRWSKRMARMWSRNVSAYVPHEETTQQEMHGDYACAKLARCLRLNMHTTTVHTLLKHRLGTVGIERPSRRIVSRYTDTRCARQSRTTPVPASAIYFRNVQDAPCVFHTFRCVHYQLHAENFEGTGTQDSHVCIVFRCIRDTPVQPHWPSFMTVTQRTNGASLHDPPVRLTGQVLTYALVTVYDRDHPNTTSVVSCVVSP